MLLTTLFKTFGGETFLSKISHTLSQGENVLLILPDPYRDLKLLEGISEILRKDAGPSLTILDASKEPAPPQTKLNGQKKRAPLPRAKGVLAQLIQDNEITQLPPGNNIGVSDFFQSKPGDYLKVWAFCGLETLNSADQVLASQELLQIAQTTSRNSKERICGPRFLAMVSPLFPAIPETKGLTVINWWGNITPADQEYLFQTIIESRGENITPTLYWWLKALCFSIGGNDPLLLTELIKKAPVSLEEIKAILEEHPFWQYPEAKANFQGIFLFRGLSPYLGNPPQDIHFRSLWAKGLLAPQRYGFLHPVTFLNDDITLIKNISQGQREVFFPLIDQVHAAICYRVETIMGAGIWELYLPMEGDYTQNQNTGDPQDEIGPLAYFLCYKLKGKKNADREIHDLSYLANCWRIVRVNAAHSKVISFNILEEAFNQLEHAKNTYFIEIIH
ncbi:MAG: hypothetical protein LBF22_11090 [Deltaproteobacteria bacterium]|jgi:hypothetical protein|nr:hypothetical protein [Deltaproteobacteria bacterium]